jgi:hypothetical protein
LADDRKLGGYFFYYKKTRATTEWVGRIWGSGYCAGVVAVVEETLEAEEVFFVKVIGEKRGGDAEQEDEQTAENDDDALVRCEVDADEAADRLFEIVEEDDVQDVDAVAVLAQPAHGMDGEDLGEAAGAKGGRKESGVHGDGGRVGEGEEELDEDGSFGEDAVSEDRGEDDEGEGASEEEPGASAEYAVVKAGSEEKCERCSGEEGICAADGIGVDGEIRNAVREEGEAQEWAEQDGGGAEEEEAAFFAEEEDGDGPDEIELLFNGEGPEVREGEGVGAPVVADGGSDEGGVLEVERERQEFAVVVDAEDEGSDGKGSEHTVIKRKDAEDSASVELAKEGGVGEGIVEDSGNEEAGEDEEEVDAAGTKGEGAVNDGLEQGVGGGGEQMRSKYGEDSEAADAIKGRYVARVGAGFGRCGAGGAGRHLCRWYRREVRGWGWVAEAARVWKKAL